MKIPNVTLLHPNFPKEELFINCSLIITIVGTSAMEGTAYGKPSIVFGDVGYSLLPSVLRIKEPEKLPELIRNALATKVEPADLDKFFEICERESFDFDWFDFETQYSNYFYSGGVLVDVEIIPEQMQQFLENNNVQLSLLADEHFKKIEQSN